MFKRLLSALSGKKNDIKTSAVSGATKTSETLPSNEELIVAYDAHGQEMRIARSDWRDSVFLPALQEKWNDAGELYDTIISGLNDGFVADLIPAAERLVEIDHIPERSHVIQGIVLMQNGQLDAAENTLRIGIAKAGETGNLLTNLAKVFSARGEETRADEILWQSIQADPNQDNGLQWWAIIQQERGGEASYLAALQKAAALPGSWLAQLWLARHYLEHKDIEAARTLYVEVLTEGLYDQNALMMISGDLGNNEQIPLLVELIAPIYDEHKHEPMAGLNLLRAYQALGNAEEGEKLLSRLYALNFPPIKQHLDQFAQAFQQMNRQDAQATPIDPANVKFSTLSLTQPIWHYGLCKADWLFAHKPKDAQQVGFFAFSKMTDGTEQAESQREDDVGRLARALPLYFAEASHYWSHYAASVYIIVAEGIGPVLSASESDGQPLFDIVPSTMTYFVTGEIGSSGQGEQQQWRVSLSLWDCARRTRHAVEHGESSEAGLGALVLDLEQRLLTHIGQQREQPIDAFYLRPSVEAMPIYLTALGQALMLTLAANEQMPKSALWGERAMLDWPLNMALHWPGVEVPKLMYISELGQACNYQSDVLAEYQRRSLDLLRKAQEEDSPAARLAPLVWKIFGMHDEFNAHRQNVPADASAAYVAWLDRVAEK